MRIINCARGELVDDDALKAALDSGKVAGARSTCSRSEPVTDHPLFGYPNVVVTPHLAASTTEAQDRAGVQTAEQVVAALTGGVVSTAVNIPAVSAEDMDVLGPFLPLAPRRSGASAWRSPSPRASTGSRSSTSAGSPSATRACSRSSVLNGLLAGHTDEEVNLVNAPSLAEERGIQVSERREAVARDFTDLVRVTFVCGGDRTRVVGTTLGQHAPPAPARGVGPAASTCRWTRATWRCSATRTCRAWSAASARRSAQHGVNISAAAVGRQPPGDDEGRRDELAVMAITTDAPVPHDVIDEIVAFDGFIAGRSVSLSA